MEITMGSLEQQVFADISEWVIKKYGTNVFPMSIKDTVIEFWKEKLE